MSAGIGCSSNSKLVLEVYFGNMFAVGEPTHARRLRVPVRARRAREGAQTLSLERALSLCPRRVLRAARLVLDKDSVNSCCGGTESCMALQSVSVSMSRKVLPMVLLMAPSSTKRMRCIYLLCLALCMGLS